MIEAVIYDGKNAAETFIETSLTDSGMIDLKIRNQETDHHVMVLVIDLEAAYKLIAELEALCVEWRA